MTSMASHGSFPNWREIFKGEGEGGVRGCSSQLSSGPGSGSLHVEMGWDKMNAVFA